MSLMSTSIEGRSATMCGDASSQNWVAPTASMYPESLTSVAPPISGSGWQAMRTDLTCPPSRLDECGNGLRRRGNKAAESAEFYTPALAPPGTGIPEPGLHAQDKPCGARWHARCLTVPGVDHADPVM